MGVFRKWVLPILRILLFAVIAVALVKIAFFADTTQGSDPATPSAQIVEPQVEVTTGTIRNDVRVETTIAADAAVPVKATLAGEVRKVLVAAGQTVSAGAEILTIRSEAPNADGTAMVIKTVTVTAPAAGIVSSLDALVGQTFAIGDAVGQIAPPSFHASGSLDPAQLYRLTSQPTEAVITVANGPAPFTCTGLTISTPLAGQDDAAPSGPSVHCAIPADVTVFAGLSATMVISGGAADDVLIVPTTAVEGVADTGNVYVVLPDGSTETRAVVLGLNDGVNVEVREGLSEGDVVLQFVPGAAALDPSLSGDCTTDQYGNVIGCGG